MKRIVQLLLFVCLTAITAQARQTIFLTLDSVVDIALNNSYRTKMLRYDIERSLFWLKARKASLKTRVYMDLRTPDLQHISDYKWNSVERRDELVMQNTQLWQSDLSVKQPVIFFGYPTNGYVSLNYRINKYQQRDDGNKEIDYYNRFYFKFEQPILLPNRLKNDLEEAQLNYDDIKLDYVEERVGIIKDVSDDYFDIFRLVYQKNIYDVKKEYLDRILNIVKNDSARIFDKTQVELEKSNVEENLLSNKSRLRMEFVNLKQRLRLNLDDSLAIQPTIKISPITVNLKNAIDYGFFYNPRLQRLSINKRRSELDVEEQKGRNSFHLTLEATYGLEKKNHHVETLWDRFDNSNSVTLNAYVPLWDGGERRARIEAETVDLRRRDLEISQHRQDIDSDIRNEYTNLREFYQRAKNMQQSMELSKKLTDMS
ncbi:TolC family protein, partial [candidate division KSB1 bacterium]|nr:TolC family protein [candidate division KSB1 bacterium]